MVRRTAVGVFALLAAAALFAQTAAPVEFPYTGVVAAREVYVRCGPGMAYYPCAKLSYPALVRAVGEKQEWLKILPPRVCFSLISKEFVRADGNEGTVTGTSVRVRAGSSVLPGRMDEIQKHLNVGDKVTILGEQGSFYKIVPPRGVYLWVAARFVKPMGALPLTTLPTQPTVEPTTTRAIVVPGDVAKELAKEKAAFDAAEAALKKEYQKPREQRDPAGLLDQYKAIKLMPNSPLKPWVTARIMFLQNRIGLAQDIRSAEEIAREVQTTSAQLAMDRAKIRTKIPAPDRRRVFPVEGVLFPSDVFRGGATGPKRYIVGDADRTVIYAYLQCTTGVVNLADHVGALVGVSGTPQYDAKSRTYVVEVEQIVKLRAPTTQPAPTTRPAATTRPAGAAVIAPAPKPTAQKPPAGEPLPPTGLPVVEPTTRPSAVSDVNAEEYK